MRDAAGYAKWATIPYNRNKQKKKRLFTTLQLNPCSLIRKLTTDLWILCLVIKRRGTACKVDGRHIENSISHISVSMVIYIRLLPHTTDFYSRI